MSTRAKIVDTLGICDVFSLREFPFEMVIDLRSTVEGEPVAIEESVLKHLNFHMVSYEQRPAPVYAGKSGEKLARLIESFDCDVLIVSDSVEEAAEYLETCDIRIVGTHSAGEPFVPQPIKPNWQHATAGVFSAAY